MLPLKELHVTHGMKEISVTLWYGNGSLKTTYILRNIEEIMF